MHKLVFPNTVFTPRKSTAGLLHFDNKQRALASFLKKLWVPRCKNQSQRQLVAILYLTDRLETCYKLVSKRSNF
ncbi:unnamed protein product [Acanthoscelides obtectus]|uniref:Uncharacterized protein n=1 Tax=Acanthoscelides obtectus TaxID=200917 RepID=A0A9P0JU97_ACAOB|nr:unnamed protein product [Acanthoscelides obtectus]CAK1640831.1 hypothetical protein AOBTE_LOCUS11952 [Acanthoscelides obtectus]